MTLGTMTPLRRLCIERGMSRRQLAFKAGVSLPTIYGLEGARIPTGETVGKIAAALEITPAELLDALYPQETAA